jgi:hypothetical protein
MSPQPLRIAHPTISRPLFEGCCREIDVRGELKEVKTDASEKPLPIDSFVAEALMMWRRSSAYAGEDDFVFASPRMAGKQPFSAGILFRRHVIPYLKQAGIEQRIGWHTFRRTVATLLTANGEDVKTVQEFVETCESSNHHADLFAVRNRNQAGSQRQSYNDDRSNQRRPGGSAC